MRTVVDHYVNTGSTVTSCALDTSKAFDRVDHYALLDLLLNRHLTNKFYSHFITGCVNVNFKYMCVGNSIVFCLLSSGWSQTRWHTVTGVICCLR